MTKAYAIKTADGATLELSETEDRTQIVLSVCGKPNGGDGFEVVARLNRAECDDLARILPNSYDYRNALECQREQEEVVTPAEVLSVISRNAVSP